LSRTAGLAAGFKLGRLRGSFLEDLVLAVVLAVVAAAVGMAVRRTSPLGAVDAVLALGFAYALPAVSLGALLRTQRFATVSEGAWPLARFGASRRAVSLGLWFAAYLRVVRLLAPAMIVGVALGAVDRSAALREAAIAGGLVMLGAGAYVAAGAMGATFLRRGRGRYLVFVLDFLLGAGTQAFAFPFPRSHLSSLLGGPAVFGLTQRSSSVVLASGIAIALAVALWRIDD